MKNFYSSGRFGTAPLRNLLVIAMIAFVSAGCQIDENDSKAASANANEASEQRLDTAVSSLEKTLGQDQDTPNTQPDQPQAGPEPTPEPERPTLKWQAPETREDGSTLLASQIKEFRIYYRLRHENTYKMIPLPGSDQMQYELDQFSPGAYEFAMTTVDITGRESAQSAKVQVDLI